MNNLKRSFLLSIIFHGAILFSMEIYLPPLKSMAVEMTPIEILHMSDEKNPVKEPLPVKERKKVISVPEKIAEGIPEIKKESPPVETKEEVKEDIVKIDDKPQLPIPLPLPPPVVKEEKKEEPKVQEVKTQPVPSVIAKEVEKKVEVKAQETKVIPLDVKQEIKPLTPPQPLLPNHAPVHTSVSVSVTPPQSPQPSLPVHPYPAPTHTSTAKTAEEGGSKYGVEGGMGKNTGDELKLFKTMIRAKIEKAKFYPMWARKRGFEGVVGIKFIIQHDGGVKDVTVVRPCSCEVLNKSACEAITKAAPFNPRPDELKNKEMAMEIDISFKLE